MRALLDGTKQQTRRVVKPLSKQNPIVNLKEHGLSSGVFDYSGRHNDPMTWGFAGSEDGQDMPLGQWPELCPYGTPGDLLWVRESCRADERDSDMVDGVLFEADQQFIPIENTPAASGRWVELNHYGDTSGGRGNLVPSIHMPRWASRLTLRITDVRVQRLQDISREDAIAEGVHRGNGDMCGDFFCRAPREGYWKRDPRDAYADLWQSINGPGSWEKNPFVWALTFEVIKQNVDQVLSQREAA